MTPEQAQEIARLRAANVAPKQIARQLGLRPAEVSNFIREQAAETSLTRAEKGELLPLERCLINENAAKRLLNPKPGFLKGLLRRDQSSDVENDGVGGLAQIFVTRMDRNQYLMCSYLVDYWCLGVKDASGPRKLDRYKYEAMLKQTENNFHQSYQEISLREAQAIIFGAIDYAAKLGIQPHADFEQAKANLGPRLDDLPAIEFGRDGKPFYISGPYDNPDKIIRKLEDAVGKGNFNFLIGGPPGF
ncbi:MAG TPA: hypothetical protein V6C78_11485 [Crinalium sp.]|jgi:hypothetical protein